MSLPVAFDLVTKTETYLDPKMKFIVLGLQKHFVFPMKENRTVAVRAEAQKKGGVVAVDTLDLPVGQTRQIWLEDVPFPVLLTKEVFPNKDGALSRNR